MSKEVILLIIPELKDILVINSPDNSHDDFWYVIQAYIGEKGDDIGVDVFDFYVTSPKRLNYLTDSGDIEVGRGLLIMKEFNETKIREKIGNILEQCRADDWNSIIKLINKYAIGEYS